MNHKFEEFLDTIFHHIDLLADAMEVRGYDSWEWVKRNQVSIYATIIFYLLLAIAIMTVKITASPAPRPQSIEIEMELIEEAIKDEQIEQEQMLEERELEEIRNIASNTYSTDQARSARRGQHSSFDDLIEQAAERRREMDANREAYEQGVREADFIRNDRRAYERSGEEGGTGEATERRDAAVRGSVTVSYSLNNPVRHAKHLSTPAYQCQGGGRVAINIIVNRSGRVISAKVGSGGDICMQETAMAAAYKSIFDINEQAPAKQHGVIVYTYVAQ